MGEDTIPAPSLRPAAAIARIVPSGA